MNEETGFYSIDDLLDDIKEVFGGYWRSDVQVCKEKTVVGFRSRREKGAIFINLVYPNLLGISYYENGEFSGSYHLLETLVHIPNDSFTIGSIKEQLGKFKTQYSIGD